LEKIHIGDAINSLENWLLKRSCQIFQIVNDRQVEPEGSGFLFDFLGIKMVVTAGHVIMDGRHNNLCFPNIENEGMTAFNGIWYPSDKIENVGNDADDFAYLILDSKTSEILANNGYQFITVNNIDVNHVPSSENIYTAIGFKWRKTKKVGGDYYSEFEVMINHGASNHFYKNQQHCDRQILIQKNRKMKKLGNESLVLTGKLEGMSGGPLWHTDLNVCIRRTTFYLDCNFA
jgi:hypothetical protein